MTRFHHIDALRAFAMAFGVILHGRAFLNERAGDAIVLVSYIFRMPLFFIVAGFFTAMIFDREGAKGALNKRLRLILVPCLFFLLCANPFAIAALFHIAGQPLPPLETFLSILPDDPRFPLKPSWHLHLWFLLTLAFFTCLFPLLRWVLSKFEKWMPQNPTLAFYALLVLVPGASFILHSAYNVTLENVLGTTSLNYTLVSMARLLPFFAMGVIFFHVRPLFESFHRFHCVPFALSAAAVTWLNFHPDVPGFTLLMRAACAIASFCSANLLFALFSRFFSRESKAARLFSDSAYTVYLLHYYVLTTLFAAFFTPGGSHPLVFFAVIAATYAICLALHVFVVSRFALTRLLINGKLS